MSVYKRTSRTGAVTWTYSFNAPDSTPEKRHKITGSGFRTKKDAIEAEAQRRVQAREEHETEQQGIAAIPRTLGQLLKEFYNDCERRGVAPKTLQRYRQQHDYISAELIAMDIREIKPLMLHHEWQRMSASGGRGRRAGSPLAAKTVRNIAGMVGAAYGRALFWGLCESNPTVNSEPPTVGQRDITPLTPQQERLLMESTTHPAVPLILELASATGARRGEVMALRWSDLQYGRVVISRSLSQVKGALEFKETKQKRGRVVTLPPRTVAVLDAHRADQQKRREQLGAGYRVELDLIVCEPDGQPLKPDSISASVSALCRRLKLPKGVSLHSLRHSHASQLLAMGLEVTAVAARLGHSSPATTMKVYSHAISGRDDVAALLIEKARSVEDESSTTKQ